MGKEKRKYDNISKRLGKLETKVNGMGNDIDKIQAQISQQQETQIVILLQEEFPLDSGRPKYRYEDIANMFGLSAATIGRIAERNGVSRRKNN